MGGTADELRIDRMYCNYGDFLVRVSEGHRETQNVHAHLHGRESD